jgi:hypothetical protein
MNAGAIVVTSNTHDFQKARESLGLSVITPTELVQLGVSISTIENIRTEMGFPSSSRNGGEISATLYQSLS